VAPRCAFRGAAVTTQASIDLVRSFVARLPSRDRGLLFSNSSLDSLPLAPEELRSVVVDAPHLCGAEVSRDSAFTASVPRWVGDLCRGNYAPSRKRLVVRRPARR
jgi:hypothetical protein